MSLVNFEDMQDAGGKCYVYCVHAGRSCVDSAPRGYAGNTLNAQRTASVLRAGFRCALFTLLPITDRTRLLSYSESAAQLCLADPTMLQDPCWLLS